MPEIGKLFGGYTHSAVLYAIHNVEAFAARNPEFRAWLDETVRKGREAQP